MKKKLQLPDNNRGWRIAFWCTGAVSAILIIAGFIVPPMGVIDGTVLTAVGEMLVFPVIYTAYNAIMSGKEIKLNHGKTSITVGDMDDITNDENLNA